MTRIADSFLLAKPVTHIRRAHQVTVAALYVLKHGVYDHYRAGYSGDEQYLLEFQQWCKHRENTSPDFQY